jgi:PAS domain S-box-containing protein
MFYELIDGVMELQGADFGDLQLLNKTTARLEIVAHRDLGFELLDHLRGVAPDENPAYAEALKSGTRIIIEDVDTDPTFAAHRAFAASAGFRAFQSTPLFEHGSGAPVGVISTRFREPHRFSKRELRLTDFYAVQAADVIACKLSEQRLQHSEERLRLALTAAKAGVWEWDSETDLITADPIQQAFFGFPPQETPQPAAAYWARMVPDETMKNLANAKNAVMQGTDIQVEERVIHPDGGIIWLHTRGHAKQGDSKRMVGISIDVTARKRMEEALGRSEARLQSAVDLLGLGLYAWDPQTNTLEWDARVKAIWGLPAEAAVNEEMWRQAIHPDDLPRVDEMVARCINPDDGGIYEVEYRVLGFDGVERCVATRGQTRFENGRPVEFLGIAIDITARKRAEQAIRETEERFRQFAEYSSNVLWILNLQTRHLDYLNPAFETVWGQTRNLEAGHWAETIHADDRDSAAAALEAASRGEVISQEYRIIRPGGSVRWIRDTMFPIRDQQGRMQRVGGIAQDVTTHTGSLVYLIESDEQARQTLQVLFQKAGYRLKAFASEAEFLQVAPVLLPGCVVLHLRSPNTPGLALPRQLHVYGAKLPVVIAGVSKGDVRLAVRAMKAGAADWLEMPYEEGALLETVASALAAIQHAATRTREAELAHVKIAGMSLRERQVLEGLLAGGTNKVIAKQLGISPRTVELHRASVMERLGVSTLPEAVLMAAAAGVRPAQRPKKSR